MSRDMRSHSREIVDEWDLGLGQMTHVRVAYLQRVASPTIHLARCRGPKHIIKQDIPLKFCQGLLHWNKIVRKAYDETLNDADSTGGLKNECGNAVVLYTETSELNESPKRID